MPYPTDISIPDGWQILSEERTRADGTTDTVWWPSHNGERLDGWSFTAHARAQRHAYELAEMAEVYKIVEATVGSGSTYNRDQYERVCAALEITPSPDAMLSQPGEHYAWVQHEFSDPPRMRIATQLRARRLSGIHCEREEVRERQRGEPVAAGLDGPSYTRAEYERACTIMQVPVVSDTACRAVFDQHYDRITGGCVALDTDIPDDDTTRELAMRRAQAALAETPIAPVVCDECGSSITGALMNANFGRACGEICYDAMADRPGRHASGRPRSGR